MAGYDIIECADFDEAIEIASKHAAAKFGKIEIRVDPSPVLFWFLGRDARMADCIFHYRHGSGTFPTDDDSILDRETDLRRAITVLYLQRRMTPPETISAFPDTILAVLFVISFAKTKPSTQHVEKSKI